MDTAKIIALADQYPNQELADTRRDFHKYAEVAWTEFRTTSKIIEFLRARGIPVVFGLDVVNPEYTWSYPAPEAIELHKKRAVEQGADPQLVEQMQGYTGAMAIIDSGKPGPTIAIRVDIDCNDMGEVQDEKHRPYKEGFSSVNSGFMHACGHDGHATVGMYTAAVLWEAKDQLCGKVKIIFQPSEEGDKGAQSLVERGLLDDVDVVISTHITSDDGNPYPAVSGTSMGLYATTKFDVEITGKNAHAGAAPEQGNHAIMAACMAIMSMNSFMQDGRGSSRLNIGTIQGGTGRNVIPNRCFFRAETRSSDTDAEQRLYNKAIACVKAACDAFDCTYTTKIMGYGPAGDGDADLAETIAEVAKSVPGIKHTQALQYNTGGTDDFTYMMHKVRGQGGKTVYMRLHTQTAAGAHNDWYDFDESCLGPGVKSFVAVVCHLMEKGVSN